MQINLAEHGTKIVCEKCSNPTFTEILHIFKVSKLITGSIEDTYVPMKTFACSACGHVNKDFSLDREEENPTSSDI